MARPPIVLVAVIMLMTLSACDESSEGGAERASGGDAEEASEEGANEADDGPFTVSKLKSACPPSLTVGVADTFTATVQNPGDEDWPVTRIGWDGSVDSIVNSITLDGKDDNGGVGTLLYGDPPDAIAISPDAPAFNVSQFQSLDAGEEAKLKVRVKPKKAVDTELPFVIWGEGKDARGAVEIPREVPIQGCDDIPVKR